MNSNAKQILLVEDNPADARLLIELMRDLDSNEYLIQVADRIEKALIVLNEEQFEAILLDLSLPDSSGLDGILTILSVNQDIPIIVWTGLKDERLALEAVQMGAQDYLIKGDFTAQMLVRSITYAVERQQLSKALQSSEAQMRRIIQSNAEGIVIVNNEGIVQFANPAAEHIFDRGDESLKGQPFGIPCVIGEKTELEISNNKEGSSVTVQISVTDIQWEGENNYLASLHDISERKLLEEVLRHSATHDPLTNLPNRVLFEDRLSQAIERSRRKNRGIDKQWQAAVMMLDLDGFKEVNDRFGHAAGDKLLQAVARRMQDSIRRVDTVARQGGDEFTLLFEKISSEKDAKVIGDKTFAVFSEPFQIEKELVHITASIGISIYPQDGIEPLVLLKHADLAMYAVKQTKNGYCFYDPALEK